MMHAAPAKQKNSSCNKKSRNHKYTTKKQNMLNIRKINTTLMWKEKYVQMGEEKQVIERAMVVENMNKWE